MTDRGGRQDETRLRFRDAGKPVTRGDAGSVVHCAPGESLLLLLEEIPATGYVWSLSLSGALEVVSSGYDQYPESQVGGGGVRFFRLRLLRPLNSRAEAVLRRPWEGRASGIDKVEFDVRPPP